MLDITVKKNTAVSLHKQLVTQIALKITSGDLPPGAKLPSVRALSRKLGVHYNTCLAAYRDLAEQNLIVTRQGSGVRVADAAVQNTLPAIDDFELTEMARYFMREALKKGYSRQQINRAGEKAYTELTTAVNTTLIIVDEHADILPLFQAELSGALGQPVQGQLLSDIKPDSKNSKQKLSPQTCYIVSRYHAHTLQQRRGSASNTVVIDLAGGQQEKQAILNLPAGSLVVIVSVSTIVLQQAEAVINALRGDELLVRAVLYSEGVDEMERALRVGQFILSDYCCTPQIEQLTKKPVHILRTIPLSEIDKIKAVLN